MKILEEDPPLAEQFKLPWIVNAFVYPISASGMIHIAVFVILPRLFGLFLSLMFSMLSPFLREGSGYIMGLADLLFYIPFYSYMAYYIAYCIINSSQGIHRASVATIIETFGIMDFVAQAFVLFGCVAICMWPAGLYYGLIRFEAAQRIEWLLWSLTAAGAFFVPMALLRGVLFDSFDALNPIEIIPDIIHTFVAYCGLVLFCLAVAALMVMLSMCLVRVQFLAGALKIYMVFVLAHRLGWFYWWHKDKLDWGI